MDAVRAIILARVKELGMSLSQLSLSVGKNHAYFQQFLKRGVPATLPEEVRGRVAIVLKLDETIIKPPKPSIARPHSNVHPGRAIRATMWIPVYGQAIGGKDGEFILNGNQVSEVPAPPGLFSVPEAYAVYVVGDSMEPRYFAGETVLINPRLPVTKGAFVVAQIAGDEAEGEAPHAFVKRFVSQDSHRLRLEQYNPKRILEFPASRVVSLHRIWDPCG